MLSSHSVRMAADAFIQLRVPLAMKAHLHVLAERERISKSALVRQLVTAMLRSQVQPPPARLDLMQPTARGARFSVRLDVEDRRLLILRASSRGMPSATYVSLLLRAHLRGVAPIPKEEILVLKRSVAELRAVGNNLNQIVKAIHQGRPMTTGREELRGMLKIAEGLRDHIKALMIANAKSWEQGNAEILHG